MAEEQVQWDEEVQWESPSAVQRVATEVEGQKTPFEQAFGGLTQPTTPEEFSWRDVGTSAAMGAGLGTVIGGPAGGVIGGITGGISGVAGEVAGTQGASPIGRFATELVAGGIPQVGVNLAQRFGASIRTRNLAKLFKEPELDQKANETAKTILFGKRELPEGYTVANSDATQANLRRQYLGETDETMGSFAPGKKVSDILRDKLYTGLREAREKTVTTATTTPIARDVMGVPVSGGQTVFKVEQNAFLRSPEFKSLMEDLKDLRARDMLDGTSLKSLTTILGEELSQRPNVKEKASQDILNLIQNGGVYTVAKKGAEVETKTKINEATRAALKKRFDEYLERNMGSKAYSELKAVEAAEFAAQARDEIPLILQSNFKYGSPEMEAVLSSIKNSPEGKKDFAVAVMQHLRGFDDEAKILSEFSRLRPALKEAGVFSSEEISNIYKNIKSFEKVRDTATRINRVKNAVLFPLVGATSAEATNNKKANPLAAFSM